MPINLAIATRDSVTFNPRDKMVNTFWFDSGVAKTNGANIQDMIVDYFNAVAGIMTADAYDRALRVQIYDQDDPQPRQNWFDETVGLTMNAGGMLPREVALVMSIGSLPVSGVPPARRRGRIYLGGLRQSIVEENGRPTESARDVVATAGAEFVAASQASVTHTWVIWSRANAEAYPVLGGSVDNAFDTQRRRGDSMTERTLFSDEFPIGG